MATSNMSAPPSLSTLPTELFLLILDSLVGPQSSRPIAYPPSHPSTKALVALAHVSRTTYPLATRYLYANCVYVNNCTNFARLRRTLGLDLGLHPQALRYGEAARNHDLFQHADALRYVDQAFVSPAKTHSDASAVPMVRLPQVIDMFRVIGRGLKRLVLDLSPVYAPVSEVKQLKTMHGSSSSSSETNIFLSMPGLEDLVISFDVVDYFSHPPPNLKRLAITAQGLTPAELDFCFALSSLRLLVFLRPPDLAKAHVDAMFDAYKGICLDVVLVDVNYNHRTPPGTKPWTDDDKVSIWEVDVPTSFYGDEDDLVLCDNWIWTHALDGSLWTGEKRKMTSWEEIKKRLAGPVHSIAA